MLAHRGSHLVYFRKILFIVIILLLTLPYPKSTYASKEWAIAVNFEIASVKMDESVTIRTVNFPVRTKFTAVMGKATNRAVDGEFSTEFTSGNSGKEEIILPIPEELKGIRIIGIRIESKDGYSGYNWFFNRTQSGLISDPSLPPRMVFSEVKKNISVNVEAINLPPNTLFTVRVGPYSTFYQNYVSADKALSDSSGAVNFKIALGANVKDAEFISVRIDGGSKSLLSSFKNVDGGTTATANELVKIIPCTLLYINPIPALSPGEHFDVVWTIQNTGLEDWDERRFLFKYREGEEMHKYPEGKMFLRYTVKRGWTYDLAVDMIAPQTPGWHSTTWALVNRFDETICTFKVNIAVQQ